MSRPGRLVADDIRVTFPSGARGIARTIALDGMSLDVAGGEIVALIGPNGCGKSTFLRVAAGLLAPERGRMGLDGDAVTSPDPRIGLVFQEPRLLPWRTVEDNVRLVAPDIADADLSALFTVLELDSHRAHFPGELSLGLARRVALARAFSVKPDLLLLDEPFVSLDASLAVRLREQLVSLVESRAMTTLLVTHDLEEAARLADRVFLLSARPARIVAEIPLTTPRRARSDREIAAMMADLSSRINGGGD